MKPLTTTAYHSPALRPGDGAENVDDTTPAAIDPASLANAITEDDTHGPYNTTGHMPVIRPADGAENQMMYELDARGFACADRLVEKGDSDFMKGMERQRDQFPMDPADIADDGWPRDHSGRPLSLLEVEQQAYAEDAERQASTRQDRAA